MDVSRFDARKYRTVGVSEGYGQWAPTYEDPVLDLLDVRLLDRLQSVPWALARQVADLACGTGRIGSWLKGGGAGTLDGVDLTPQMLERARVKQLYRQLHLADVARTPLDEGRYDLVTAVLVDEHLPDLAPLYREAARIARPGGNFVLVGYHPFFLLNGIPTHFDSASGEPLAIECYVHLFSDHVRAALSAGWELREMHEGLVDEAWLEHKPKWRRFLHQPVSFALAWQLAADRLASPPTTSSLLG
jgi:SAM-dependent methyltransferase